MNQRRPAHRGGLSPWPPSAVSGQLPAFLGRRKEGSVPASRLGWQDGALMSGCSRVCPSGSLAQTGLPSTLTRPWGLGRGKRPTDPRANGKGSGPPRHHRHQRPVHTPRPQPRPSPQGWHGHQAGAPCSPPLPQPQGRNTWPSVPRPVRSSRSAPRGCTATLASIRRRALVHGAQTFLQAFVPTLFITSGAGFLLHPLPSYIQDKGLGSRIRKELPQLNR